MKKHFSPLVLEPPLLSSSFLLLLSFYPSLIPCYPQVGQRETWKSAQELGAEYRSAAGGNWCPGYLAYVIDPELEKEEPCSVPSTIPCPPVTAGRHLLCYYLLTGVMPQTYQVMSLLNHHSRHFSAAAAAALHNKMKSLVDPLCAVLYPPSHPPPTAPPAPSILLLSAKESSSLSLDYREKVKVISSPTVQRIRWELWKSEAQFQLILIVSDLALVFNIPWRPHEQWKGLTRFHRCLPHPRGTLKSVQQFRGTLNR